MFMTWEDSFHISFLEITFAHLDSLDHEPKMKKFLNKKISVKAD